MLSDVTDKNEIIIENPHIRVVDDLIKSAKILLDNKIYSKSFLL